jgi:acyl-CoA thioesterase
MTEVTTPLAIPQRLFGGQLLAGALSANGALAAEKSVF